MTRILLADDSSHAQRMGERILREEGFEVVTVTDGQTALIRLGDVDPDLVVADVSLPRRSGYEICREIKKHPRYAHVRVVLTAGLLESFDEAEAAAAKCDGTLRKPFESSVLLDTIRPLLEAAARDRGELDPKLAAEKIPLAAAAPAAALVPPKPEVDPERVRAAVTVALDAALPAMIDKITEQVLIALGH
jgi:CheY-like chemotaxis protein